jgi:hypothetical protein
MSSMPRNNETQLSVPNPPHIEPSPPLDDYDESEDESTSSQLSEEQLNEFKKVDLVDDDGCICEQHMSQQRISQ